MERNNVRNSEKKGKGKYGKSEKTNERRKTKLSLRRVHLNFKSKTEPTISEKLLQKASDILDSRVGRSEENVLQTRMNFFLMTYC